MTATLNRRGLIVLQKSASEKWEVKPGDVLVVVHDQAGRLVLQKRQAPSGLRSRGKRYLTPSIVPSTTLERIYRKRDPEWDRVEAEAVAQSRRAKRGLRLEDL